MTCSARPTVVSLAVQTVMSQWLCKNFLITSWSKVLPKIFSRNFWYKLFYTTITWIQNTHSETIWPPYEHYTSQIRLIQQTTSTSLTVYSNWNSPGDSVMLLIAITPMHAYHSDCNRRTKAIDVRATPTNAEDRFVGSLLPDHCSSPWQQLVALQ